MPHLLQKARSSSLSSLSRSLLGGSRASSSAMSLHSSNKPEADTDNTPAIVTFANAVAMFYDDTLMTAESCRASNLPCNLCAGICMHSSSVNLVIKQCCT